MYLLIVFAIHVCLNSALNHVGREHCKSRMVDLDTMTIKDAPKEFYHAFIDKGLHARLPVYINGSILKHQFSVQVSLILVWSVQFVLFLMSYL